MSTSIHPAQELAVESSQVTMPANAGMRQLSGVLTATLRSIRKPRALLETGFHVQMSFAGAVILIVSILGCMMTSVEVPDAAASLAGVAIAIAAILPLIFYTREKGWLYLADATATFLWALFLYSLLNFPVTIAARLGRSISLQDPAFIQLDRLFGIYVPGIESWAENHGLGNLSRQIYSALIPLLEVSVMLPIVARKVRDTQQFLTANVIAFALGLPIFALLPAIGPWYGYHLAARPDETECQALIFLIRNSSTYLYHPPAGIICFPSFHVIWSILCAQALWGFRWLRLPVSVLSLLIILSTMTLGVHYFCDVLAGILVAALAILGAKRIEIAGRIKASSHVGLLVHVGADPCE